MTNIIANSDITGSTPITANSDIGYIGDSEIWKPVPHLPGIEASSAGRIRGVRNAPTISNSGYEVIAHLGLQHQVHRLVCLAFHGEPPAGKNRALHWNDQKLDNRACNLRWGSAQDNADDARRNGIVVGPRAWKREVANHAE